MQLEDAERLNLTPFSSEMEVAMEVIAGDDVTDVAKRWGLTPLAVCNAVRDVRIAANQEREMKERNTLALLKAKYEL